MLTLDFLQQLACPLTKQPLQWADSVQITQINDRIAQGGVVDCGGQSISQPLEGGLISQDATRMYPIAQGIPILIRDRAIPL